MLSVETLLYTTVFENNRGYIYVAKDNQNHQMQILHGK